MNTFIDKKLKTKKIGRYLLCIIFLLVLTLTGYSFANPFLTACESSGAPYSVTINANCDDLMIGEENSADPYHTTADSPRVVAADSVVYSDGLGKAIQPQMKSPTNNKTICNAPVLSINGSTQNQSVTICENTYTSIGLSSNLPGTTYTWTLPVVGGVTGASTATNTTSTNISYMLHLLNSGGGIVIYNVMPTAYGCQGTALSMQVHVKPYPAPPTGVTATNTCGPNGNTTISGTPSVSDGLLNFYTTQNASSPVATGTFAIYKRQL
jgi:hypothetical protein